MGRETLCTSCKILTDIAGNTSCDVKPRHIIAKHFAEFSQNLIQKLRGRVSNCFALKSPGNRPKKKEYFKLLIRCIR
jgi:hypothetical protein